MNRRGFFRAVGALAATPALGMLPVPKLPFFLDELAQSPLELRAAACSSLFFQHEMMHMVYGAPGIGKTAIMRQACAKLNIPFSDTPLLPEEDIDG